MRKKKILIGLTTAFLALTALASCGSSKSGGESKSSSSVVENSSESSKDEQKSSSEQNQGQGEESSSEQNQGQGEESSSEQNQGQGNESESSSTVEAVIEGDSYKFGFGDGLTSWSVLPEKAGTKEVTDSKGNKTTVLASAVSVDQFSFSQNDKNRVDPIKNELEEIIGYVYVSQKADITIKLKTAGKIVLEGKWGSTSTPGKIYVKNSSGTAVYTSNQYTASTDNVVDFSTNILDAGTYIISSDASVRMTKLYYEREYNPVTVAFSTEHGSVDSVTAEAGDVITLPELSEEGFVFKGWYTENSSTGTKVTSPYTVTAGTTLYAKWVEYNPDNYATVTFNTGVSGINKQSAVVEKGSTYTVEALEYDGYRFMGWFTDSDFKYSYTGTITDSVTLYAQFIKIHTVSYQYDDGTEISSEKVLDNESLTSVPTTNTIVGKRFVGWTLNDSDFNTESAITSDIVLVAKYETIEVTGQVAVMNSAAYQEGLYAEFMQYDTATEYNAYVSADGTNYTKLDSQLIRKYKSGDDYYYRVDAVGLKAGSYTLKIAPVFDGTEADAAKTEVSNLNVIAHDRSGFAFVNGTSSGAYNEDGTLRSTAVILYITQNTKDTVSMDVVTNNKGATTTAVGLQGILNLYKKGYDTRPLDVRFVGQITDLATMEAGDIVISGSGSSSKVSCGITFEGIGNDATIDGWGLRIKNASNVEVRNLGFMNCNSDEGDDCGLQQDNDHVWVHNCDFFYGDAGSDADQVKGDGALDTKKSTYVTNSYNHFWDCGKCNLLGLSEGAGSTPETWCITYHHNWYDHSDSRHPRVRYYTAHVYNNYYDGNAKYGVGATLGSSVFVENNYFRNCKNPIMTSMQGTDVYAGTTSYSLNNATFSKEAGGSVKSYGNVMVGNYTYIPYGCTTYVCKGTEVAYDLSGTTSTVDFDAYEASSRDEVISDSVISRSGSNKYNNFDTSSSMYTYTVQSAEDARNTVIQYSGRVQGGDFKWTFTEADDTSSAVNQALKNALMAYKTKLVSVQGDGQSQGSGDSGSGTGTDTPVEENAVDKVIALIEALPEASAVTSSDATKINAAKSAYDALSETDQALVTNYSKLQACVSALAELPQSTETLTFADGATGNNSFFTVAKDSGTPSNKSGVASKTYNGVEYTSALKVESKTTISFTTTSTTKLVIITDSTSITVTVDGTAKTPNSDGVIIIENLAAGDHVIARGSGEAHIYAVIVE